MNYRTFFLQVFLFTSLCSCASLNSGPPNEYVDQYAELAYDKQKEAKENLENFFESMRGSTLVSRTKQIKEDHHILRHLDRSEKDPWFEVFFETLVGTELMAQSNSFRTYSNESCYDAYNRPLGLSPRPIEQELMSLFSFMKAGPRIPTEPIYNGQVKLFCGRRSINTFKEFSDDEIAKIYLSLKYNRPLKRYLMSRASKEATLILEAYRAALLD